MYTKKWKERVFRKKFIWGLRENKIYNWGSDILRRLRNTVLDHHRPLKSRQILIDEKIILAIHDVF